VSEWDRFRVRFSSFSRVVSIILSGGWVFVRGGDGEGLERWGYVRSSPVRIMEEDGGRSR